jgi:hypothetical protein
MEILQEKGAGRAYSLRGIGIEDRSAVRGRVDRRVSELRVAHICANIERLEAYTLCLGKRNGKKVGCGGRRVRGWWGRSGLFKY